MTREKLKILGAFVVILAAILAIPLLRYADGANGRGGATSGTTSSSSAPMATDGRLMGQFRGVWLQLHNNDPSCPFEDYVREIAKTGANTVCLSVAAYQENCSSSAIFVDQRKIPPPERITSLIQLAKSRNKRVIYMPILLLEKPRSGEWRGKIKPEDWAGWWQYYTDYILLEADLAQHNGVDLFMVGSELISTEDQTDKWQELIKKVRDQNRAYVDGLFDAHLKEKFADYTAANFKDKLGIPDLATFAYSKARPEQIRPELRALYEPFWAEHRMLLSYSSNWDHYTVVKYWDSLDAVGMTSYYNLNPDKKTDPSLDSLLEAWKPIKEEILTWQRQVNKPIIFTEVGWASQQGCSTEPWNYYHSTTVSLVEQDRCMESFLKTFGNEPWVGGVLIWKWRDNPGQPGGPTDYSYTPVGKPVMKTIEQFFQSPDHNAEARKP